MKFLLSFLAAFAISGCGQQPTTAPVEQKQTLYLHFFRPCYSSEELWTSLRILTTKVRLGEDIDIRGKPNDSLSGIIELRDGKIFADVKGGYATGVGYYKGPIELEKPFEPSSYFISAAIFSTRFVLSTNPDCKPFLVKETEKFKLK